jgi:septal ring factor EnvC (AmiA/AmiB activator)
MPNPRIAMGRPCLRFSATTVRSTIAAFALAVAIAVPPPARAELLTGSLGPPPDQELEAVERALSRSNRRQQVLSGQVKNLKEEAAALSRRLVETAALIQSREALITASEARLAGLHGEQRTLERIFAERNHELGDLLSAVILLERNPPPALVVTAGDALEAVRAAMLFGATVPALRSELHDVSGDLARLAALQTAITEETEAMHSHLRKLRDAEMGLEELHDRKRELASLTGQHLKKEREAAADLAARAKNLRELVENLAEETRRRELAEQAAAGASGRDRTFAAPLVAFSMRRGQLAYPVLGEIIGRYGDADPAGAELKGMLISARAGAQVTSPADARVEFAGSFRSYGQLLILDVGEGYHVLLAGLGRIEVETGQTVRGGEPLGIAADARAQGRRLGAGVEQSKPVVYVELRKSGESIDPAPWWIGGVKQARSEKGQN